MTGALLVWAGKLAPTLDVYEALLRGEPVEVGLLDQAWLEVAKRQRLVTLDVGVLDLFDQFCPGELEAA